MTTAIVLFTRDLRVHDNPALHAALSESDQVAPVFVLDDAILASRYAAPNRVAFLLESLRDLRSSLVDLGGSLIVRRGDPVEEVAALAELVDARAVHLAGDVSAYARRRESRLRDWAADAGPGFEVHVHPGVTVVPAGELAPSGGGDYYKVFTPYWRKWRDVPVRQPLSPPTQVELPRAVDTGRVPAIDDLIGGRTSPDRPRGGESIGRDRLDAWLEDGIEDYPEKQDDLGAAATSGLSPYLHLGNVSTTDVVSRLDLRRRGHEEYLRQLCWRDFNHQVLWGRPDMPRENLRDREPGWRDDPDALQAWKEGRTGYPIVDAAMRQLRQEGFMHNRARMIVASFLTKHLMIHWREGAWHFMDWLVDGDLANNFAQWQWTAGTGLDTRPNRMFNPASQQERHDPDGDYVERHLGDHQPPPPIVDHADARARFLPS